ncbi:Hypothetical predicted protein [Xyrichtys novacula]|uniref:Uncharacterized protein n=1 Tax=Xyrichtys novacula TaxID=13765 RepID=A0AAV1GNV3_XYRNO|nr:Hypothetical predicted protein [Xyrichtys novacula]
MERGDAAAAASDGEQRRCGVLMNNAAALRWRTAQMNHKEKVKGQRSEVRDLCLTRVCERPRRLHEFSPYNSEIICSDLTNGLVLVLVLLGDRPELHQRVSSEQDQNFITAELFKDTRTRTRRRGHEDEDRKTRTRRRGHEDEDEDEDDDTKTRTRRQGHKDEDMKTKTRTRRQGHKDEDMKTKT